MPKLSATSMLGAQDFCNRNGVKLGDLPEDVICVIRTFGNKRLESGTTTGDIFVRSLMLMFHLGFMCGIGESECDEHLPRSGHP